METEVARFTKSGGAYRDAVVSIVRREYLRQRRNRDQWYARHRMAAVDFSDRTSMFLNINTHEQRTEVEAALGETTLRC